MAHKNVSVFKGKILASCHINICLSSRITRNIWLAGGYVATKSTGWAIGCLLWVQGKMEYLSCVQYGRYITVIHTFWKSIICLLANVDNIHHMTNTWFCQLNLQCYLLSWPETIQIPNKDNVWGYSMFNLYQLLNTNVHTLCTLLSLLTSNFFKYYFIKFICDGYLSQLRAQWFNLTMCVWQTGNSKKFYFHTRHINIGQSIMAF